MELDLSVLDAKPSSPPQGAGLDLSVLDEEKPAASGMVEPGNIDLARRPVVRNDDGSISTVRSMSVNIDGQEVLIPTVSDDGRIMGDDEAVEQYRQTGRHLGKFRTPDEATTYAEDLHRQQEAMYAPAQPATSPAAPGFSLPQAYELARERDPERTARVLDLSSVLSSPPDVVDRNLDKASAAATARENAPDFARLAAEAPATARHLAIPTHMAVSKDDTDNMGAVESFFKTSPYTYGFRMLARGYMQSVQSSLKLLDDASKLAQRGLQAVGVPEEYAKRGGAFEDAQAAYAPPAWAPAPEDFSGKLMAAVGRLPMDLGILMMLSKLPGGAATAMGLEGAVQGGAEDGWTGAAAGGAHGALTGGILSAFGYLPRLAQAPAAGAFGYGMTLHETGDQDEALAQGLVLAGFHAPQFLQGVRDVYAKSKTLARSPAVAEAHLAEVLAEAGYPETSYIPAREVETVFAPLLPTEGNGKLKKFLSGIGVSLSDFHEAGRMDLDLEFPTSKLVRFLATDEGKALLDKTQWTPFADPQRARELAALREQAQAGPGAAAEGPAEGQAAGNVLDLSGVVPGDAVVNPSDLLRRAGLDPDAVSQALGPIADAPMPVADIVADGRFQSALKLLNYDGVRFGEAAKPEDAAVPVEAPVLLTRKGGAYSESEALAKLEELKKQGVTTSMATMEGGGYGLAVDAVEQPNPAQVRQTIERAVALAVQNQKAPYEVIGVVEPDVARRIKENTGQDALVFRHVIDPSFVSHVFSRHGIGNEKEPGHRGVEPKDILRIPDVLLHPDDVQTGSRPGNVVFVKRVNGTIYYVESARPGSRTLEPRTMWIRDAKYPEGKEGGRTPASSDAPGNPEPRAERPQRLAGSEENIRQGEAEGKGAEAEDMDVVWPARKAEGDGFRASVPSTPAGAEASAATPSELPGQRITVSEPTGKAAAKDGPVKALFDTLDPLQARAENALPVEIALTADHISVPEARQAALDNPNISAITLPGDRVIFIADRTASPEQAVKRWVHEQGIHQGLRVFLGADLDTWRDGLAKTYGVDGLREVAEAHGIDLSTPEGLRRAAEERFALIADRALLEQALSPEEATLWQRFVQMFRDGLRRRGVAVEFTDAEIAKLARDSLRATLGRERPARDGGQLQPRDVVELALAKETMGMERAFEDQDVLALAAADPTLAAELKEYDWLYDEAQRQAEARMDRIVARERAAEEKQWRAEAADLYEQTQGWQAYKRCVEAGGLSETTLRLFYDDAVISDLKAAANKYEGYKERNRRQKLVVKENALIGPDELAAEFGFRDSTQVDDFVQFLLAQPGRKEFVDRMVASRRQVLEEPYHTEEAIASDAYERVLAKQSEIFGKLLGQKPRGTSEIKKLIEEQTGVTPWTKAISEQDALVASLKRQQEAARAAFREGMKEGRGEARAKGKEKLAAERQKRLEEGFEATERLREAVARVKERVRVKEEVDKALTAVQEAVDSRTVDFDFAENIKALAARFGFTTARSKMPQDPRNMRPLRELLEETLPPDSLVGMVVPEKYFDPNWRPGGTARRAGATWKDMTFDELVEFGEVIDALAKIGRKKNYALSYESRRSFDDMALLSAQTTMTLKGRVAKAWPGYVEVPGRPGRVEQVREGLERFRAALTKPEFVFRAADGWEYDGPNYRYGFKPLVAAMARELELWERKGKEYKAVLEPFLRDLHQWGRKKIRVEGVPQLLSKEEMIAVALNCGNEGNLTAVRNGYGWTDAQVKAITDRLSAKEWQFVTDVWALIDSMFPQLSEEYRRIYGRPLRKVEVQPYETPHGTVQGGYYPLVFDPKISEKAEMFSDQDLTALAIENVWQQRGPASGMTKERQGGKLPPLLKLDVIERHLRDTIHYTAFAAPLRDVYKFVNHPETKAAYVRHLGRERQRQLVPWLQSIAREERGQLYELEGFVNRIRLGATMVNMGLKVTVAMTQPLAYAQTIEALGFVPAMRGLARFARHPLDGLEFVRSKSVFFRARETSLDRDIRDASKHMDVTAFRLKIGGKVFGPQDLKEGFFALTAMTDALTAAPTWLAAYEAGQKRFKGDDAQATDYADMILRTTQGSGLPIDLAKVQRGSAFNKLFTMFYSFFSLFGNLGMERLEQAKEGNLSPAGLARSAVWLWLVPAAVQTFIMSQEETKAEDVAYGILSYPMAAVPFARDIANPILQQVITGKTYGYQGSPAGRAGVEAYNLGTRTAKAARDVATGRSVAAKDFENLMKSALMAAGYWYQLPSRQIWITYEGARDLATGKTKDPRRLFLAGKKD